MSIETVVLDAGPLGRLAHPRRDAPITAWAFSLARRGVRVVIPQIADYEVRRELIRAGKTAGLRRLDELRRRLYFQPIVPEALDLAAEFWASARRIGRPTAPAHAIDADAILAAQATILADVGQDVVVATVNVRHLSLFVTAKLWQEIE